MIVTLYTNSSDNKVVSKSITQIDSKTCNPFKEISVIAPVIIVAGEISASANYMYIDKFARYYYITNIVYNGNQSIIYGRVDSLMSFSGSIYGSNQFVSRSEKYGDNMIVDSLLPLKTNNIPTCIKFGDNIRIAETNVTKNIVLGVI